MLPLASAAAWQSKPPSTHHPVAPLLTAPSPRAQFDQSVQQHQTQDQLQKNQLEQQLHQGVSDNIQRSSDNVQRAQQNQQDRQRKAAESQSMPAPAPGGG
jgi:hypothetical protein